MKAYPLSLCLALVLCLITALPSNAETDLIAPSQTATPEATPQEAATDSFNFEVIMKKSDGTPYTAWSGQMFSVATAKPVDAAAPEQTRFTLEPGNYMLMVDFMADVPEDYKGKRPFTFAVKPEQKTLLTITIGGEFPNMEKDILRTTKGEDYFNTQLASPEPQLCKSTCEKDRNCGAYTYCYYTTKKIARCYLIRGAGTPGPAHPGEDCFSGVIQRDPSPFQSQITLESLSGQPSSAEATPTPAASSEGQQY